MFISNFHVIFVKLQIRILFKIARFFKFFEFHLEWGKEIVFIWDISELSIQYMGEIIYEKVVLSPQDFLDGTVCRTCIIFNLFSYQRGIYFEFMTLDFCLKFQHFKILQIHLYYYIVNNSMVLIVPRNFKISCTYFLKIIRSRLSWQNQLEKIAVL